MQNKTKCGLDLVTLPAACPWPVFVVVDMGYFLVLDPVLCICRVFRFSIFPACLIDGLCVFCVQAGLTRTVQPECPIYDLGESLTGETFLLFYRPLADGRVINSCVLQCFVAEPMLTSGIHRC